jgi:hypothetical protein
MSAALFTKLPVATALTSQSSLNAKNIHGTALSGSFLFGKPDHGINTESIRKTQCHSAAAEGFDC